MPEIKRLHFITEQLITCTSLPYDYDEQYNVFLKNNGYQSVYLNIKHDN